MHFLRNIAIDYRGASTSMSSNVSPPPSIAKGEKKKLPTYDVSCL